MKLPYSCKGVCCFVKVFIIALIAGFVSSCLFYQYTSSNTEMLREHFYNAETATHVSPHHIRKHIAKGDDSFILVDLRSQEEYEREHVIGAYNVPAYASPEKSAYGDVERIVTSFKELAEMDKEMIVYCYSGPCMTGRKIGKILADHGIYVKHLGIGWNEWRYDWTSWNHEHEWNETNVHDFVISGAERGAYEGVEIQPQGCSAAGEEISC